MNISGKWKGILKYGEAYKNFAGRELAFELTMEHSGELIHGQSIDLEGFGRNSDPATIQGSFVDNQIAFEKQYPSTLSVSLWRKQFKKEDGIKSPIIYYTGVYDPKTSSFSGTWEINETRKILGIFK